jgi:hypothetical protein
MWHRVDVVLTDVSEERIASIFRVERKIRKSLSEEIVKLQILHRVIISLLAGRIRNWGSIFSEPDHTLLQTVQTDN